MKTAHGGGGTNVDWPLVGSTQSPRVCSRRPSLIPSSRFLAVHPLRCTSPPSALSPLRHLPCQESGKEATSAEQPPI